MIPADVAAGLPRVELLLEDRDRLDRPVTLAP
jgi:hypothetical protein